MLKAVDGNVTLKVVQDSDAMNPRKDMDGWIGTMVCAHRRYELGDEQAQNLDSYRGWAAWLIGEIGRPDEDIVALPLYLYDHSGITMNTTGFHCPWDSGQVGWIYATKQKFLDETGYTAKALFGTDPNAPLEVGDYVIVEGADKPHFGKVQSFDDKNVIVDWTYLYVKERHSDTALKGAYPREKVKLVTEYAKQMLKNEVKVYDQYLTGDVYGYILEEDGEVIDSCWGFYGSDPHTNGMADYIERKYHHLFDKLAY